MSVAFAGKGVCRLLWAVFSAVTIGSLLLEWVSVDATTLAGVKASSGLSGLDLLTGGDAVASVSGWWSPGLAAACGAVSLMVLVVCSLPGRASFGRGAPWVLTATLVGFIAAFLAFDPNVSLVFTGDLPAGVPEGVDAVVPAWMGDLFPEGIRSATVSDGVARDVMIFSSFIGTAFGFASLRGGAASA